MADLTPNELQVLIDYHDNASAGAEAQDYFDAAHYHATRSEHFSKLLNGEKAKDEATLRKMIASASTGSADGKR